MRVSFFYVFLAIGTSQLLLAHTGFGQLPEQRKTKIELKNDRIETLFAKLKEQAGLSFLISGDVGEYENINLPLAERTVKEVLDLVLLRRGLAYRLKGSTVFIHKITDGETNAETNKIPIGIALPLIKGQVIDAMTQQPMAGVNVFVKGTTRGTSSDNEGRFLISAREEEILVFSFIGFKTFETTVGKRSTIDIAMEQDVANLNEVVVSTGYWDVEEKLNPGNVAKINAEDISKQPVTNPLQALQGRVSGVDIQQFTGLPGGQFSIQIRGRNSISRTTSEPFYIIDGVPYSSESLGGGLGGLLQNHVSALNSINPSDIESIEILKDADATAIYGSRGANGVVLIKTKRGKASRTSLDIDFSTGFGQVSRTMDLLNTNQYLEMKKEALKNSDRWPLDPSYYKLVPDVLLWDSTRYTDWQKKFIGGTAKVNHMRIAFSGGSPRTQYLFSGSYNREGSVFPGDFLYQKASTMLNLTHTSEDEKFKLTASTSYTIDNNELPMDDLTGQAVTLAPNAPALFDDSGNINWENNTWLNPMATYLKPKYSTTGENLITNASFSYEITKGFHARTNLGYNRRGLDQLSTTPYSSARPDLLSGFQARSGFGNGSVKTWIIEPQAEFSRQIRKGTLIVLVGTSFQETKKHNEVKEAIGFTSDALLENIKAASTVAITLADAYQYRYTAVFGRLNYNLNDKYILNLTARRDGSSRFGPNNRFGNFGAVGAAWIFTEEEFIKSNLRLLSFGKLRASYGTTGSDNIGDYQYLDSYTPTQNPYQGVAGLVPARLANDNYGWETNRKLEAGIEVGLLHDRIFMSTSFYRNRSSNQLVGYSLPVISGQSTIQRNLPATVENSGCEIEVKTENLRSPVSWSTSFNITIPRNKLIAYPDLANSPYATDYVVGEPLSIQKKYRYIGVDPITGYYIFQDLNEDGMLTVDDYQPVGKIASDFFLGVSNTIQFAGLKLDIHFQAVRQTGRSYISNFSFPTYNGYNSNQPVSVMARWRAPGDVTNIQKFASAGQDSYYNLILSDRYISDASYIRLRNVQLSYLIPTKWLNKIKMKKSSVYIQGQNLLTITNYEGLDPESQNSFRLPPLRVITAGIQLSF